MNKMTRILSLFCLCLALGCQSEKVQSVMRTKPHPLSDFLPDHQLLERQPDTFPFHYYYQKPANLFAYERVYVAPVCTTHLRESDGWASLDKAMDGKLGNTVSNLAVFARQAYVQAFEKASNESRLTVTDRKDQPKTLILETAIVTLVPTKAELKALGVASNFIVPGLGLITAFVGEGTIVIECRIRDAQTGKIIAMYGDAETDPKAILPISSFTWSKSSRINIKMVAANTARVLSARDYRQVRRDSPIKFISRIKDGDLDEKK